MPQKKSPLTILRAMDRRDQRRFAIAVFFLFGSIGPLIMLMESSVLPGSWFRLFYFTVLSGIFFASIILLSKSPFQLIVVLVAIQVAAFSGERVEEFLFGRVESTRILTADHLFTFRQDEIDRIHVRHPAFGIAAIILLSTGYVLLSKVILEGNEKRTRLETESAVTRSIQKSIQPATAFTTEWCDVAGVTVPATEVGGDYFDVVKISDDQIAVVVADVSGHGVSAGILSAMTKSAFHEELRHTSVPSELLANLNATIYGVTDRKLFASLAYVLLDRRTMTAQVATAGHLPVLLFRKSDETIFEAHTPNLALAVQPSTTYAAQTVQLDKGDELVLYTDGVIGATNDKGEEFGVEKLKELIANTERPSVEALSNSILASVRAFTVKKEFADDATIVVARV